jgi:hypothetical protein
MKKARPALARCLTRTLWGLVFLLGPLPVMALDMTPDASRVVSDPSYLPNSGQFFGSTQYNNGQTDWNTDDSQGVPKSSANAVNNTINQLVEFGFTDTLTLRASGSYLWIDTDTTAATGVETETQSNGFSDVAFEGLCRVLDQKNHPFSWDLFGIYTPNLINAESASSVENGTVARGGASAGFGSALSYKTKDFTIYGSGTATCLDERTVLNPGNQITTSFDTSWQKVFTLSTQTRLMDKWSLNANVSRTFSDNQNASFVGTGGKLITFVDAPGGQTAFTGALNYQAVPNRFVVSLIYIHNFYDTSANTYATQMNSDITIMDKQQNILSGEIRYVLN